MIEGDEASVLLNTYHEYKLRDAKFGLRNDPVISIDLRATVEYFLRNARERELYSDLGRERIEKKAVTGEELESLTAGSGWEEQLISASLMGVERAIRYGGGLALALLELGHGDKAAPLEAYLEKVFDLGDALRLCARDRSILSANLARIAFQRGDRGRSEHHLKAAEDQLAQEPDGPGRIAVILAHALTGEPEKALAMFRASGSISDNYLDQCIVSVIVANRYDLARRMMDALLERGSSRFGRSMRAGFYRLWASGDLEAAQRWLEETEEKYRHCFLRFHCDGIKARLLRSNDEERVALCLAELARPRHLEVKAFTLSELAAASPPAAAAFLEKNGPSLLSELEEGDGCEDPLASVCDVYHRLSSVSRFLQWVEAPSRRTSIKRFGLFLVGIKDDGATALAFDRFKGDFAAGKLDSDVKELGYVLNLAIKTKARSEEKAVDAAIASALKALSQDARVYAYEKLIRVTLWAGQIKKAEAFWKKMAKGRQGTLERLFADAYLKEGMTKRALELLPRSSLNEDDTIDVLRSALLKHGVRAE